MDVALTLGIGFVACNLGPVAEFTSKCISIIKAHHLAETFLPSIFSLPKLSHWDSARNDDRYGSTTARKSPS